MYVQCNTDLSLDLCVPICAINLYYPNSNNSTHLFENKVLPLIHTVFTHLFPYAYNAPTFAAWKQHIGTKYYSCVHAAEHMAETVLFFRVDIAL